MASGGCTPDYGVVVRNNNGGGDCYSRQFSGPVHLAWYGVKDASDPSCYDTQAHLETNCAADVSPYGSPIVNAFNAALPSTHLGGDGGVVTDGRSIVIADGDLEIPSKQYFSCSGPPGGNRTQIHLRDPSKEQPYYTLPNSVVLKADTGFTVRRDANSLYENCIERPTWYTKAVLDHVKTAVDAMGNPIPTRIIVDEIEHAFVGTGTTCGTGPSGGNQDGEACNMRDVLILGFDTCDDTRASANAVLQNVKYECNMGEFIHDNGGGMKLADANVHNFIEADMEDADGNDISKAQWHISNVLNGTGSQVKIKLYADGGDTADQVVNGDTVIVTGLGMSQPGTGPLAHNARWLVQATTRRQTRVAVAASIWWAPHGRGRATAARPGSKALTPFPFMTPAKLPAASIFAPRAPLPSAPRQRGFRQVLRC